MRKFFVVRNKDAAESYVSALVTAGYVETKHVADADFLLYDYERGKPGALLRHFAGKPKFIYPHTPYSWWIWDGICRVDKVSCNFAVSEGAKLGMLSYGYDQRIEVCGFPRCEVTPFQASEGTRLLFAPAHIFKKNLKYPTSKDSELHQGILKRILLMKHSFESITVRFAYDLKQSGFADFVGEDCLNFEKAELTVTDSVRSMDKADVIVSCGTFGYLSLARGKPTILYGNMTPYSRAGKVCNYSKYRHFIDFPRPFEELSSQEVLNIGLRLDPKIEEWKRLMIGQSFDPEKFVSVIREFA